MEANDPGVSLLAFLSEAQRQVRPAQVSRRRQTLRRVLAECNVAERPPEPCVPYLQPDVHVG